MMIPIGTPCVIVETVYAHLLGAYCTVVEHFPLVPGTGRPHPCADHKFHVPADAASPLWDGYASNVRPIGPPPRVDMLPPATIKPQQPVVA